MKVELKNIKLNDTKRLGFKADIFINDRKIGLAQNNGDGSATSYKIPSQKDTNKLLSICEQSPAESVYFNSQLIFEIKLNIEKLINNLFLKSNIN